MATTNKRFVAKNGLDNNNQTITNIGAAGTSLGLSGTGDLTIAISGTATLTLPAGSDTLVTLTGTQTLINKTLTSPVISSITNTGTLTLPTSTDTLVGRATTDTLTNKTISGANNTLSNIGNASLSNSTISGIALGSNLADLTMGTGVSLNSGTTYNGGTAKTISIGQAVATTDNVTFAGVTADNVRVGVTAAGEIDTSAGNLTLDSTGGTTVMDDDVNVTGNLQVDGNLTVSGTTVTVNATNLAVEDNMIYLNSGSAVANPDLGFAGNYNDGTYRHAGLFRDATDGVFKFFHQYVPEPDASAYIDTTHGTFALAPLEASSFTGTLVGAAPAGSLSGSTLASGVTASSLTSVGTLTSLTVSGSATMGRNAVFTHTTNPYVRLAKTNATAVNWDIQANSDNSFNISDGTPRLVIDASGNLGIGTTSPLRKLHVAGDFILTDNAKGLLGLSTGAAQRILAQIDSSDNYQYANGLVSVLSSGNVGIGTTSPAEKLHVTAGSSLPVRLVSSGYSGIEFHNTNGTWAVYIGTENGSNGARYNSAGSAHTWYNNSAAAMTLNSTGLGIGTTSPSNLLHLKASTNPVMRLEGASDSAYVDYNGTRLQLSAGGGAMYFVTGNSEKVRIDSSGNVGIGTTSPATALHLLGTLTVGNSTYSRPALTPTNWGYSASYRVLMVGSSSTSYSTQNTGAITVSFNYDPSGNANGSFNGDGREILFRRGTQFVTPNSADTSFNLYNLVLLDGNVGIGTSPQARLHVQGGDIIRTNTDYVASSAGSGFVITPGASSGNTYTQIYAFSNGNTAYNNLVIPGGNVGIGTTSPASLLHVKASGNYGTIISDNSTNTGGGAFGVRKNGSAIGYLLNKGSWYGDTSNDLCLSSETGYNVRIYTDGSATEKFIFTTGGSLGIGTTSPGSKLDVRGATRLYAGGSGWTDHLNLYSSDNTNIWNVLVDSGASNKFRVAYNSSQKFEVDTSGNVGLGAGSSASYRLYVSGDQYINGTLTEASSMALKENIHPITDALSIIKNITGYTYDRKDGTATNQSGFIAEQVAEVLPGVVSVDEQGNPSGVQYTKIIAYLVESIKELKAELDELKRQ